MTDIPNTEYITINKDGVFVGGKPAVYYRGEEICDIRYIKRRFSDIQKLNPDVAELHVLSSATSGEYAKTGNPSHVRGSNEWCRIVWNDGTVGPWVFFYASSTVTLCASACAHTCVFHVHIDASFRSVLFGVKNKEYVTINAKGIFVGGKHAKKYRGQGMYFAQDAVNFFKDFQNQNKNVAELHILSSETSGTSLKSGKPSRKHGKYPWCRVKFDNGNVGPWVPDSSYEYNSASNCAYYCVRYGALNVCQNVDFRSAVLEKSQTQEMKKLKKVDLSVFEGKTLELNGYEIVVRKLAETQQIKR